MTLRLPLFCKRHATIINAYAPTMTNPDEVKAGSMMIWILLFLQHPGQTLILLGDFNARVGTDHQTWERGSEGVEKCNSNGLFLLRKCPEHELLITNTIFRLPTRRKTSWMHPRSKHWHLIDYVIERRRDRQDVRVTKSMCGADCWTDHRLVASKLNLRIQPVRRPQGKNVPKKLDVSKLKQDSKRQAFVKNLCSPLDALEHSSEDVDESLTETPFTLQQWIPSDQYLANTKIGLMRMAKKSRNSLKRNTKNTRLTSEIPAQYLVRLLIQTYARQYRLGSETCKTSGWAKRLMKSSPLQTEMIWRSSLMHSRQYMVPRAQEPPHSLVQMELVFWLIKKLEKMGWTLRWCP